MKQRFFLRNFLLVTLPVILVIVLLGWIAVYIINSSAQKAINDINIQTVSRIRESTELIFSEADAQSLNYSITPHVMLQLEALLENGYSDKEQMDTSYMIKTFVDSNVNTKAYIHSLYIYLDNTHNNFFASFVGLANVSNFRDTAWLEQARSIPLRQKQWLELRSISSYGMTSYSTDVLSIYKRIYASNKTKPIGVLVLNTQLEYLNDFYSEYLSYPEQNILLLNSSGEILSMAGDSGLFSVRDHVDIAALKKLYYIASENNDAYGITYLSLVSRASLYQQSWDILHLVIAAIVTALFLGGTIAFMVTRRNTKDIGIILQLVEAAENDRELPNIKPSTDVYGYITQSIVKGFLERAALDRQLVEKKYRLETMYFSFLQSQLNPHFLFNTLKNIFWKTIKLTGDPNEASRMIDLLANVLYYTLVNSDRYVDLEDEIKNTQKYLEIQQMRFDDVFHVEWEIKVDTHEIKCIKFLLQPLVENSLSHGLNDMDLGKIEIKIVQEEECVFFSVTDNGTGFSDARLQQIREWMLREDPPVESIGLFNLNKRLILTYGESSALKISSIPRQETRIEFMIPQNLSKHREKTEKEIL
ncbi:cache domain-containing sensor histidine kinase [Konateibacter massiliensis]|uniref:cache domain-containing sensor histidine kinase n=1 Tax=Konateibacter massiliensis TaxID=2002841 RepID=UPI000C153AA7|nr:sensor histidine kinase [Konateibacter massiliensis]